MDAETRTEQSLRFGSFELDVRSRELRKGKTSIRLQEQPFEILRMMLERPGHVVTRDELRHRLWPDGTFVDFEHSLNAAVKRLRAALGDDAENPRFVETLPRRGYRFIGGLEPAKEGASDAPARVRLAVLPFASLSEDAQEYFTDGLTEEMIAQLGQLCRGRVGIISRWSSMLFKGSPQRAREIGRALQADYLLEGSVRGENDRVRITARLVEAASETDLWVETYERDLTDCLSVQADVAARVARSLAVELLPDSRTPAPVAVSAPLAPPPQSQGRMDAYQSYLKGRYHWNMPDDDGVDQALFFYNQAVQRDGTFAAAYAAIARARILKAEFYREAPRAALVAARAAAVRAVELDAATFEGHLALGDVRRMLEWDWSGAEQAYSQAISLNPSYESAHRGLGLLLSALTRHGEAIRECEHACDVDPLCLTVNSSVAWVHYAAGNYAEAIARARHTVDMDPRHLVAQRVLAAAYLQSGREGDAIAALESAREHAGDNPLLLSWLAHARAVTGSRREAASLVQTIQRTALQPVPAYHLAIAHAGLGDLDAAFDALDQASVAADPALLNLAVEPRFEPLRPDRRYRRLIDLLGLQQTAAPANAG